MSAAKSISQTFRLELLKRRAAGERIYEIARAAGVRANELSGLSTGSVKVRRNDVRVARVAAVLGLSAEQCFDASDQPEAS